MPFLLRKFGAGLKSLSILAHVPSMYINLIQVGDAAGDVSNTVLGPKMNVFYEANARSFPRGDIECDRR